MLIVSKDLALMGAEEADLGEGGRQAGLGEEMVRLREYLIQILALLYNKTLYIK